MRRIFIVAAVLGTVIAVSVREYRLHHEAPHQEAFVGGTGAVVWNSTAEIREPVANLTYGQPVQVYQHYAEESLISTSSGIRGWVSSSCLLDPELWRSAMRLDESAKSMAVQAVGHTRARSNLHTQPGRQAAVILQAPADSPLVVFTHGTAADQLDLQAGDGNSGDWWLVRANVRNAGDVTGWALDRLIALDLPEPLPEYQVSAHMHIVAWFEIDRALDSGTQRYRPEYLAAATRGHPEGCDFNLLRVYTWSSARQRYETAFMDSHVCGKLPLDVIPAKSSGGDAYFSFNNFTPAGAERRRYFMKRTTVRRVDADSHSRKQARKGIRLTKVRN